MAGNETDEIIQKLSSSILQKHKKGLEKPVKDCEFVLGSVKLLH